METDDERYIQALELLRAALEICLRLMDTEVDCETVVNLGGVVSEIEAAITAIEAERRAIPMREG